MAETIPQNWESFILLSRELNPMKELVDESIPKEELNPE